MGRASKHCGRNGCRTLVAPPAKRCPEHVGWNMSPRTASAQATNRHRWRAVIRPQALARDGHQCQLRYPGLCVGTATEVDHIVEVADGGPDELSNARSACSPCHRRRTAVNAAHASHTNR